MGLLLFYGVFHGVKRPGSEVDSKTPSSANVKNEYSSTSTPLDALTSCTGTTLWYREMDLFVVRNKQ